MLLLASSIADRWQCGKRACFCKHRRAHPTRGNGPVMPQTSQKEASKWTGLRHRQAISGQGRRQTRIAQLSRWRRTRRPLAKLLSHKRCAVLPFCQLPGPQAGHPHKQVVTVSWSAAYTVNAWQMSRELCMSEGPLLAEAWLLVVVLFPVHEAEAKGVNSAPCMCRERSLMRLHHMSGNCLMTSPWRCSPARC